jgi:hypothetical protein
MPEGSSVSLYSRLFTFICGCFSLRLGVSALLFPVAFSQQRFPNFGHFGELNAPDHCCGRPSASFN